MARRAAELPEHPPRARSEAWRIAAPSLCWRMKAAESVYADEESDSERGYMLRKGSRTLGAEEKSW